MVKKRKNPAPKRSRRNKQIRREQFKQRLASTFTHIIPLGSTCLTARHLEKKEMRIAKYPFDWIYSTPYLVRHAITDNFKAFLDPKQYSAATSAESRSPGTLVVGTRHKIYHLMQDTKRSSKVAKVLFPHHQLWSGSDTVEADRESYRRAVQRFRKVLRETTNRTLFVLAVTLRNKNALQAARDDTWILPGRGQCPVPKQGGPELCSQAEVLRLFQLLQQKCKGPFHFDVVYLVTPKALIPKGTQKTTVLEKTGKKGTSLKISEVYCKGNNTGLVFEEDCDMVLFHKILTEYGYRRFSLKEDTSKRHDPKVRQDVMKASKKTIDFKSPQSLKRRLQFVQKNPKIQGSEARERYEKYKKAKTLQHFLDLGGSKADFVNDKARGYVSLS